MKLYLQLIFIVIFVTSAFYIVALPYCMPVSKYINNTECINIDNFQDIRSTSSVFNYDSRYGRIIYDNKTKKFYAINLYPKDRNDRRLNIFFSWFFRGHNKQDISIIVNIKELNDINYGTEENPIPAHNFKRKDDTQWSLNEDEYKRQIREYFAERIGFWKFCCIGLPFFFILFRFVIFKKYFIK